MTNTINYQDLNKKEEDKIQSVLVYSQGFNGHITNVIEYRSNNQTKACVNGTTRRYHYRGYKAIKIETITK